MSFPSDIAKATVKLTMILQGKKNLNIFSQKGLISASLMRSGLSPQKTDLKNKVPPIF